MPDVNDLDLQRVPLDSLVLDDRNARKGNVASIVASLQEFGQHRPVIAQRGTNKVIGGNHLVMAARTLGWTEINVVYVDDDDEKAIRRGIADNATGDQATWDQAILKELLDEVGTDVPGVDDSVLRSMMTELDRAAGPKAEPVFPITADPGESYSYVMVIASHEMDETWLREKFGLRNERSYKNTAVGLSRVVSVGRLRELWGEVEAKAP